MKRKNWLRINEILRKRNIHPDQVKHINDVRPHPKESDAHWSKKCKIARKLYKSNHPYLTEAWTYDRKRRFDIIDLMDDIVYELETDKKVKKEGAKTIFVKR